VATSTTAAPAADATATAVAAAAQTGAAAAGEVGVAAAVHQRLLAAACVQKQLAAQSAEFKRRFGEMSNCTEEMAPAFMLHIFWWDGAMSTIKCNI
jgi:L-asparaginase/Glu-tRNA(Gln) amidotransferase subunit D